jgi:hypothetical protein
VEEAAMEAEEVVTDIVIIEIKMMMATNKQDLTVEAPTEEIEGIATMIEIGERDLQVKVTTDQSTTMTKATQEEAEVEVKRPEAQASRMVTKLDHLLIS